MRIANGDKDPYRIKTWCLGSKKWTARGSSAEKRWRNTDGWRYGNGKGHEADRSVCGACFLRQFKHRNTYLPAVEAVTLERDYDYVDYVSLHSYYGNRQ